MACTARLALTDLDPDKARTEVEALARAAGWIVLAPRDEPRRPWPVDVCADCFREIMGAPTQTETPAAESTDAR